VNAKLRASLGTGAKAPGLYQLFDPSFGNPDLGVEESSGYDIGADLVWSGGATVSVSYFSTEVTTDIDFEFPAGYLNYGATRAHGVETFAPVPISSSVNWSFSHTWLDAWDRGTGQWLGRPRHSATTRLSFAASDRLHLTARARYRSENGASFGGTANSFVTVDLLAGYELNRALEVYGRIVNLFDQDYQYEWGSSTYDRSIFAGVRMRY
jgi:vitamin B12 transporter